jgi:Tfp pilus assembly protein PilO
MQTGLEGKPWHVGLLFGVVISAILVGALWWTVFDKMAKETEAKERELAQLEAKIQQGRAAKQNLARLQAEVATFELELEKLLRILPFRRNTPDLIRRIRLLVERGDLNLKTFLPRNPIEQGFYSEWPIQISLDGSYHNLALFFDRISRFSRIINIENLQIKAITQRNSPHTIEASFTAKTFIYNEQAADETTGGEDGNAS